VLRLVRTLVARLLPRGVATLSALFFASYVLGFVRDRAFAQTFGAGSELDAFIAAFRLPELLFDVLVEAGLAAPFIPIFLRLRTTDTEAADRFARTILSAAVAVMGVGSALLFVFAEPTIELVAPGFKGAQRELYLDLFRVMLITQVLFAASLTLGQVLLAEQRFFWYAVAPLLYNAGIIAGTVVLAESMGIYGPAIGAVLGAAIHLGSRFIGLRRSRLRVGLEWELRTASVREFVRLMLPRMVAQPVEPTVFLFFTNIASALAVGSVTVIDYARNFQGAPVTLIGVAYAVAAFPRLSTAYAERNRGGFLRLLATTAASIAGLTVAAALALIVLGELVIGTAYGGGAFNERDVAATAAVLSAFALSVPFESLAHLLSRAIYATHNTLLQVLASLLGLAITVVATLALLGSLEILAIPIGFTIGQVAKVVLLGVALGWRMRRFGGGAAVPETSGAGAGLD
jgi:putative peptidoglycan lipid II flippase